MGEEKRACVSQGFVFLTFRGPLASHDSNPYPNRSRIARYNATKPKKPADMEVPGVKIKASAMDTRTAIKPY